MKYLKMYLLGKVNVLLSAVLVLLGYSCCPENAEDEPMEYGCPFAYYNVEGAVLDSEGKALKDIRIMHKFIPVADDDHLWAYPLDTLQTDAEGKYKIEGSNWHYTLLDSLRVIAEDPSGVYATDSVDVELTLTKKKAGSWCRGTLEGQANITLQPKNK